MKRAIAAIGIATVVGCGAQSDKPPAYTPVNSPETESSCPDEWQEAKTAREALLDDSSDAARRAASKAILTQAECERVKLASSPLHARPLEQLIDEIRAMRIAHDGTYRLYVEASQSADAATNVAASAGGARLFVAFSNKLTEAPLDALSTEERVEFLGAMSEVHGALRARIAELCKQGLDRALKVSPWTPAVQTDIEFLCATVRAMDSDLESPTHAACK